MKCKNIMDKTKIKIYNSFSEAEADDIKYYHSLSPVERLRIVEELRQMFYEDNIQGFPRVFEIAKRS
jgi:hypothetical protein